MTTALFVGEVVADGLPRAMRVRLCALVARA